MNRKTGQKPGGLNCHMETCEQRRRGRDKVGEDCFRGRRDSESPGQSIAQGTGQSPASTRGSPSFWLLFLASKKKYARPRRKAEPHGREKSHRIITAAQPTYPQPLRRRLQRYPYRRPCPCFDGVSQLNGWSTTTPPDTSSADDRPSPAAPDARDQPVVTSPWPHIASWRGFGEGFLRGE